MEIDIAFLKSLRGAFKVSEMVVVFASFVCFAVAVDPPYIAATCMEFFLTLALLLLYLLKLNKALTFFFWPLIDVFNSAFAAVFMFILGVIALCTYTTHSSMAGGIIALIATGLWSTDGYLLSRKITFNQARNAEK